MILKIHPYDKKLTFGFCNGKGASKSMEISICIGSSCHLKGSHDLVKIFERLIALNSLQDQIELKGSFCMGECTSNGVCVSMNGQRFKVTPMEAETFFRDEVLKRLN